MNKFSQYFAIERKAATLGIELDRADLVAVFTNNEKHGLKDLTDHEYQRFIIHVRQTVNPILGDREAACNKMRRTIISHLRKIGYELDGEADMSRIYAWVLDRGYLKKPLNKYTYNELPTLVTQSEIYLKKSLQ